MKALWKRARWKAAARMAPQPTAWGRFLDHAEGCPGCRNSHRCPTGERLHDAVRRAARTATP